MVKKKDTTKINQKIKKLSKEEIEYNSLPDKPCNRELFNKYVKNKEHYKKIFTLKSKGASDVSIARSLGVCLNTMKKHYRDVLKQSKDDLCELLESHVKNICLDSENPRQLQALMWYLPLLNKSKYSLPDLDMNEGKPAIINYSVRPPAPIENIDSLPDKERIIDV